MDILTKILIILSSILWIWAIYDTYVNRTRTNISLIWLFLILIFPMIGPIIYFQLKRRYFLQNLFNK